MAQRIASAPQALRGEVVLINFWTYSCINWRRQLPYVRAWVEKYKKQGLVVVDVHAPEFEFERNIANIKWAVKDMEIDYPVAVDDGHVVRRAFGNRAWPALYFVERRGASDISISARVNTSSPKSPSENYCARLERQTSVVSRLRWRVAVTTKTAAKSYACSAFSRHATNSSA